MMYCTRCKIKAQETAEFVRDVEGGWFLRQDRKPGLRDTQCGKISEAARNKWCPCTLEIVWRSTLLR